MKSFNVKKIVIAALAFAALLVGACEFEITEINFPEDAKVNSEVTFTVKCRVLTDTDDKNTHFVFALLAPKSWDLKNNAKLTFTTEGMEKQNEPNVTNEPMVLIPDNETERSTALPYPTAYQSKIGLMDNYGPVEWTVWKSTNSLNIVDKQFTNGIENVYAIVTITLKTGPEPVKFNLGAGFCGTNWGMTPSANEGRYEPNERYVTVTVSGEADEPINDYTVIPTVSVTPSEFRYGDIFAVNFDGSTTELKDSETVYLQGRAVLADGTEKLLEAKDASTKMNPNGEANWMRYIYPKALFGLPQSAQIKTIHVWFTDGTTTYVEGDEGKLLVQAAE